MTENRNEKLLNEALRYIAAHTPGEEAYRFLHDQIGITNEELMQYGLDGLRGHFQYEREEGTPWREFAEQMDGLLLRPDVYTTSAWISFAGELAEGVETIVHAGSEQDALCLPRDRGEIQPRCRGHRLSGDPCPKQCAAES